MKQEQYFKAKNDYGKSRIDLIEHSFLIELKSRILNEDIDAIITASGLSESEFMKECGYVMAYGAQEYGENTWQNLPDGFNRSKAALFRHVNDARKNPINRIDGCLNHWAQVAINYMFMLYFDKSTTQKLGIAKLINKGLI